MRNGSVTPRQPRSPLVLLAAVVAFTACSDDPTSPGSTGFRGSYALGQWAASAITGGTTAITPNSGEADTARFSYIVNLGPTEDGVSFRTARYSATPARTGTVTFDWVYTGDHAFFQTRAVLIVFAFAEHAIGPVEIEEIDQAAGGGFTFSGSSTIDVEAGQEFGVVIGGSNFDSNGRLNGTLKVFNFVGP